MVLKVLNGVLSKTHLSTEHNCRSAGVYLHLLWLISVLPFYVFLREHKVFLSTPHVKPELVKLLFDYMKKLLHNGNKSEV